MLGGLWFFMNILSNPLRTHPASYEGMAAVSMVFFLVGCYQAPQSWKKAESRYESDMRYLEVMRQHDSTIVR
jgi:hypothetical protein